MILISVISYEDLMTKQIEWGGIASRLFNITSLLLPAISWRRALLEKLVVAHIRKNVPSFKELEG
jgi:hypothetical protein